MKIYIEKIIFINRAPFNKLELDFNENEIAVLTAINGSGKTTLLSYIVDAWYEMARPNFPIEFEEKENKYYRVSTPIYNLIQHQPSYVYIRFKTSEVNIDYIDIRNKCTEEEYNAAIKLEGKIPYNEIKPTLDQANNIKKVSLHFDTAKAEKVFFNNLITYFPSYRFEEPGYLNEPYKVNLDFKKLSGFKGYLKNPLEVITGLPQLANWIMDIVLDMRVNQAVPELQIFANLNNILTETLISKKLGNLRFGIGMRGKGSTRIQIMHTLTNAQVYPTIFNLSAGESSILCLFGELLRQADNYKNNIPLNDITGIVLIDEVDKHLHIKLQKEVLPKLFNLFPNVQFILSTHAPFLSLGLAEVVKERSIIIDLDNMGISTNPTTNELYTEVYNMMVGENDRFKEMYESIVNHIETSKILQIVTEGNNNEHIEKAISTLSPELLTKIQVIKGSENKSGDQQLKNAFDIMSKGDNINKFLFVWDCDSTGIINKIIETDNFFKFCFEKDMTNTKAEKGIENLYSETLFTSDVYDVREIGIDYGGSKIETVFNKHRFLEKIKKETSKDCFQKFIPLINKIHSIINPTQEIIQTSIEENSD